MNLHIRILAHGLGIFLSGCGIPTEKMVVTDFLRNHPNATVLSVVGGEGDFDNVYFQIRYTLPDSSATRSEVWLYQRDLQTDKWHATKKGLPDGQ